MAEIIDGAKIAKEIREELKNEIKLLKANGIIPGLVAIIVGNNPASEIYVRLKRKAADKVGIISSTVKLKESTTEKELLNLINDFNNDHKVHGILVQMPFPVHMDEGHVLNTVIPEKDVDGFHPVNVGKVVIGDESGFLPCTPAGIQEILWRSGFETSGRHTVIVGRSNIVGKPLMNILLQKKERANSTVTICHTGTKKMDDITRLADILVVAAGRPEVINGSMIKKDAIVIDVGINRIEDPKSEKGYRLVGDVHFESANKVAKAITPVPGGVGPMTIAMLLKNTIKAAKMALG